MLRIGVLGAGYHSFHNHGPALRLYGEQHPGEIELTAVCDMDTQKAGKYAREFGFQHACNSIDTLVDGHRLDALLAITPLSLTEQIVGDLLPRGIPLLIEKPPGENSIATRRLRTLAERGKTPHMLSFNRRFNPALQQARQWLAGSPSQRAPRLMIARMLRHQRREPDFVTGTGIHAVDAMISLMGTPGRVFTVKLPSRHGGVCSFQSQVTFTSGAVASLTISPSTGVLEETYEIHGDDYTIWMDALRCSIRIRDCGQEVLDWIAPAESAPVFRDGTLGETEAFFQFLKTGQRPVPDLNDGLLSMLTAEAIQAGGDSEIQA